MGLSLPLGEKTQKSLNKIQTFNGLGTYAEMGTKKSGALPLARRLPVIKLSVYFLFSSIFLFRKQG
jgi:hypothetical protein